MTVAERALGFGGSRAERVRARRVRGGAGALRSQPADEPAEAMRAARPRRRALRRRYDLVLPIEAQTVVRLPSVPVFHLGPRLLSAVLFGATLLAIPRVVASPGFRVESVEVVGQRMLSANQVRSIARSEGRPVFWIDPAAAAERLTAMPEIASARVRVGWPNRVTIQIEERHPLVAWNDGGRTWWIGPDGIAFLEHGEWPGLVKVQADEPVLHVGDDPLQPVIEPELLWAAAALSAQVPEVDVLRYHPDHGLGFEDSQGWTAFFGDGGDMVAKMRLYRTVAGHLIQKSLRPTVVSVEDPTAPYFSTNRDEP